MPEFPAFRVYLDANILFSASYDPKSRFLDLWKLHGVTPVTSLYAVGEVWRHVVEASRVRRFHALLKETALVSDEALAFIPEGVVLAEKDRPILSAAIAASVEYLVTGDKSHFGHLYGKTIGGVSILLPAEFLDRNRYRLRQ